MTGVVVRDIAEDLDQPRHALAEHASLFGIAAGLIMAALVTWLGVLWMQYQAYVELNGCLSSERIQRQLGLPAPEGSCVSMLLDPSTITSSEVAQLD